MFFFDQSQTHPLCCNIYANIAYVESHKNQFLKIIILFFSSSRFGWFPVTQFEYPHPAEYQSTNHRNDGAERIDRLCHRQRGHQNCRNQADFRCHDSHLKLRRPGERLFGQDHHNYRRSRCCGARPVFDQHEVSAAL